MSQKRTRARSSRPSVERRITPADDAPGKAQSVAQAALTSRAVSLALTEPSTAPPAADTPSSHIRHYLRGRGDQTGVRTRHND